MSQSCYSRSAVEEHLTEKLWDIRRGKVITAWSADQASPASARSIWRDALSAIGRITKKAMAATLTSTGIPNANLQQQRPTRSPTQNDRCESDIIRHIPSDMEVTPDHTLFIHIDSKPLNSDGHDNDIASGSTSDSDSNDDSEGLSDMDSDSESDSDGEKNIEQLKPQASAIAEQATSIIFGSDVQLTSCEFYASGTYNRVWLVRCSMNESSDQCSFILRIPREDEVSLHPHQLRNEVACLRFVAEKLPKLPAPRILAWDDGTNDMSCPFMAETFIEGKMLDVAWPELLEDQKCCIVREIANVVADLGETRFESIGGLREDFNAGPIIEAGKLLMNRHKHHDPAFYNIGPYPKTKDYVLSCYDREIYFYQNGGDDIDQGPFTKTPLPEFLESITKARQQLCADDSVFQQIDSEPIVLCHEDFHAGNMVVRDGHLVGVLDWEFSSLLPLSELNSKPYDFLTIEGVVRDDSTDREEEEWQHLYHQNIARVTRERGWEEDNIKTLMGGGHAWFKEARKIKIPKHF